MNFLAHFFTARASDELLSGSFLGDFVRGSVEKQPERFRAGIALHRRVDSLTDDHHLVLGSVARIRPACGRYAPVALDVIFDYLLANSWSEWTEQPFEEFVDRVYSVLRRDVEEYPEIAARVARSMAEHDWLASYRTEQGIRFALRRMNARLRRPSDLSAALDVVMDDLPSFREEFTEFFRDLLVAIR